MQMTSSSGNRSLGLIAAMLDYVRTGQAHGELVAARHAEPAKLRLLCLSVLEWLSSRGRVPKMTSMATSEAGSARDALVSLVASDDAFSATFRIEDDRLML